MKSIKEKAEEYSRCIASSEYTREDFVSGANYVLGEIEKCMEDKNDTITDWIILIRSKIKELKGSK